MTPYLEEHGTRIAGLADNAGGDERYFNNLIVNEGLAGYDPVKLPMFLGGNVYLNGATLAIDTDYFGAKRNTENPFPGPFNEPEEGRQATKVWPKK